MRRKIPIGPGQPAKDAELISVNKATEEWNEYLLADGAVIKMKVVLTEVWRIVDEYDQEGNPVYVVRSSPVITINAPDQLRKPGA